MTTPKTWQKILIGIYLASFFLVGGSGDLYALLGLQRSASQADIKSAYRKKARLTHPDKNPGVDPETAAKNFRAVVEAYETLSDTNSRRVYDQTGRSASEQRSAGRGGGGQQQQQQQQQHGGWSFHFNFGGFQRQNRMSGHRLLYNHAFFGQIMDAQSRVIEIKSIEQLRSIAAADAESSYYDPDAGVDGEQPLDRYVLLAFYDSSMDQCEHNLQKNVLFPWPYAGYSNEGGAGTSSIWWDEILLAGKVDLSQKQEKTSAAEAKALAQYLGVPGGVLSHAIGCPLVTLLPRGGRLSELKGKASIRWVSQSEDFRAFIWPQLKVKVTFENKTKWPLSLWWLDGYNGKRHGDIPVDDGVTMHTFLSHTFFARASFVTGYTLTNESGLLWYTARMEDDDKVIEVHSRCFDHDGECTRWRHEGFCDPNSDTFYVRQNPNFRHHAMTECPVSCKTGCGADQPKVDSQRRGNDEDL